MKHLLGSAALVLLMGMGTANAATTVFTNAFGTVYHAPPGNVNGISGVTEYQIFMQADGSADQDHIGNVGGQNSTPLVQFHTDANLTTSNGFAQIGNGSSDIFHSLSVAVAGFTIHDLMFDTYGAINGNSKNDVSITGFFNNIATLTYNSGANVFGTGGQSWLLLASALTDFDRILISSSSGFTKIDHLKISGRTNAGPDPQCVSDCSPSPVPLPASLPLFGSALGGLLLLRKYKRKQVA